MPTHLYCTNGMSENVLITKQSISLEIITLVSATESFEKDVRTHYVKHTVH